MLVLLLMPCDILSVCVYGALGVIHKHHVSMAPCSLSAFFPKAQPHHNHSARYDTFRLQMRQLRHRGRNEDTERHSQLRGGLDLNPGLLTPLQESSTGGRFDLPELLSNNMPTGREDGRARSCSLGPPPRPAGGRGRNPSGWLALMLEECLEKSA